MVFERPQKRASQPSRLSSPRNVFQRQYLSKEEEQAFYNRPIHKTSLDATHLLPDAPYTPPVQTKTEESNNNQEIIQEKSEEKPNKTGLPDNLKTGVENLSGYSLDDVRVHYNSPKPAQLQALAYTQGTDIHVASGQEQHLPHEAWHVVQQMQGRVKPTMQMKGVQINDDQGLEREAEQMGAKADSVKRVEKTKSNKSRVVANSVSQKKSNVKQGFGFVDHPSADVAQCKIIQMMNNKSDGVQHQISALRETKSDQGGFFKSNCMGLIQREVYKKERFYYSLFDKWEKPYEKYEDASQVDQVLEFIDQALADIFNGVGDMDTDMRARIARIEREKWPSWIPPIARANLYVEKRLQDLIKEKENYEEKWRKTPNDPQQITNMLLEEGYSQAEDVFQSYRTTTGAQQAGYRHQLEKHKEELLTWNLDKIEPHYMSSQGDTNRRADSLLIGGGTQDTQSQYYPPEKEPHNATLVDHKFGYRTENTARFLQQSVDHAGKALPIEHKGKVLPTVTNFQFHDKSAPRPAQQEITTTGNLVRQTTPSAFSGGLTINSTSVIKPASPDALLKRQCGCVGKSDEETASIISSVVHEYTLAKGCCRQLAYQLELFKSLSDWFDDLSKNARFWLSPLDIYKLCKTYRSDPKTFHKQINQIQEKSSSDDLF